MLYFKIPAPLRIRKDVTFNGKNGLEILDTKLDLDKLRLSKAEEITIEIQLSTFASDGLILFHGIKIEDDDFGSDGSYFAVGGIFLSSKIYLSKWDCLYLSNYLCPSFTREPLDQPLPNIAQASPSTQRRFLTQV